MDNWAKFFISEHIGGFQVDKKTWLPLSGNQVEADILGRGASPRERPLLNISAGRKFFAGVFCVGRQRYIVIIWEDGYELGF